MAKTDNPHSLRLYSSIQKHSDEETATRIANKISLSKSADIDKKFIWAESICTDLEKEFSENMIKLIRMDCACGPEMGKINNLHKKKQGMLKDILRYISNNYNKKITLQDIGHTINLSPQYACKLFKELTNSNITTYINNYRIQSAVTLLREGDMSITEISLECGFESLSYINRVFKRQFGCTPSEYRQKVSF